MDVTKSSPKPQPAATSQALAPSVKSLPAPAPRIAFPPELAIFADIILGYTGVSATQAEWDTMAASIVQVPVGSLLAAYDKHTVSAGDIEGCPCWIGIKGDIAPAMLLNFEPAIGGYRSSLRVYIGDADSKAVGCDARRMTSGDPCYEFFHADDDKAVAQLWMRDADAPIDADSPPQYTTRSLLAPVAGASALRPGDRVFVRQLSNRLEPRTVDQRFIEDWNGHLAPYTFLFTPLPPSPPAGKPDSKG